MTVELLVKDHFKIKLIIMDSCHVLLLDRRCDYLNKIDWRSYEFKCMEFIDIN